MLAGIGYETVKYLVANGAISIMACRDASRAAAARSQILNELSSQSQASDKSKNESQEKPLASNEEVGARLLVRLLDLCSLRSVRAFVEGLEGEGLLKRLDLLILNAGGPGIHMQTRSNFSSVYKNLYLVDRALLNL